MTMFHALALISKSVAVSFASSPGKFCTGSLSETPGLGIHFTGSTICWKIATAAALGKNYWYMAHVYKKLLAEVLTQDFKNRNWAMPSEGITESWKSWNTEYIFTIGTIISILANILPLCTPLFSHRHLCSQHSFSHSLLFQRGTVFHLWDLWSRLTKGRKLWKLLWQTWYLDKNYHCFETRPIHKLQ